MENGLTLKQLRVGAKYTQAKVAEMLGINVSVYGAIESIDEELIAKLAKLYGVKPDEIKLVS